MPNSNYLAGRRFEYEVMKDLRNSGYKVIRASGSHGEFDIIAYKPKSALFIQCKVVETVATRDRMIKAWRAGGYPNSPFDFVGTQQLWVKVKGDKMPSMVSA